MFFVVFVTQFPSFGSGTNAVASKTNYNLSLPSQVIEITFSREDGQKSITIPLNKLLFEAIPHYEKDGTIHSAGLRLNPSLSLLYKQIGFPTPSKKAVYVYPIFTQAAYGNKGFYDYYRKSCDTSCLTIPIPTKVHGTYSSSILAAYALTLLNYSHISDIDIDRNPGILKQYDEVIVLHNEYVTQDEFNAITSHPNVIYLFPNALYAKVIANYKDGTVTLVRGHGYPTKTISNGFGWKNDNSKYEYNYQCANWQLYKVTNGKMLNCYPEYQILSDKSLLQALKN